MPRTEFRKAVSDLFRFNGGERRGVLALLPLLAVAAIFVHGVVRFKSDAALLEKADSILSAGDRPGVAVAQDTAGNNLFSFDPNTVTIEELCALGFELRVAASIVKYRSSGKVFTAPEDLAMCYGVTLEKYLELEPYIVIGKEFAGTGPARRVRSSAAVPGSQSRVASAGIIKAPDGYFDPNSLDIQGFIDLGFTAAQARTIINYRNSIGGFTSPEQFSRCYAVDELAYTVLAPYIILGAVPDSGPWAEPAGPDTTAENHPAEAPGEALLPLEINSADSVALRSVSGIGEVLVVRILDYRTRLGGFARIEQLAEIQGMTRANYERIVPQIWVDSCKIRKIDINFTSHKQLAQQLGDHPYMTARQIRKLLSVRQLKGGWSNTRELVEDEIWNEGTAVKMAPYVVFRPIDD